MSDEPASEGPSRSYGRDARLVLATVLIVALVLFAVDNRRQTRVEYLVGHADAPLWLLLASTAIVGAVIGALMSRHRAHRH